MIINYPAKIQKIVIGCDEKCRFFRKKILTGKMDFKKNRIFAS